MQKYIYLLLFFVPAIYSFSTPTERTVYIIEFFKDLSDADKERLTQEMLTRENIDVIHFENNKLQVITSAGSFLSTQEFNAFFETLPNKYQINSKQITQISFLESLPSKEKFHSYPEYKAAYDNWLTSNLTAINAL